MRGEEGGMRGEEGGMRGEEGGMRGEERGMRGEERGMRGEEGRKTVPLGLRVSVGVGKAPETQCRAANQACCTSKAAPAPPNPPHMHARPTLEEPRHVLHASDALQHAQHGLVGASVQGAVQRAHRAHHHCSAGEYNGGTGG